MHKFLNRDFAGSDSTGDLEADELLFLVAQLLPGDGVTQTTLISNEARKRAIRNNDFKGAVKLLLDAFVGTNYFKHLTDGKLNISRGGGSSHMSVIKSEA